VKTFKKVARESIAAGICLGATGLAVAIWEGRPQPPAVLPLVFLVLVIWLAVQFGRHAGFFGTILASAALAFFVYSPEYSFRVEDHSAGVYLGALFFGGIIGSELLADPPSGA